MNTAITKIQDGAIVLPKKMLGSWQGAKIVILPSAESIYIKKISKPSLDNLKPKLQKLGKLLNQKDIDAAIKLAKQKTYKSCP
ncbi:hypothetical protein A2Y83_03600 [Candidatus Falkowbacteria bacterium RBG_13_39_14]|uniref:Uncharacterized protein n=1 Tax=Candidatus Falkowbacteria bacterium RBG_13_39_14 TaxID=1797985 RepID=A0A1F5S6D5_9BACT|nr:MAG: hypothetical protein A2Y83_03600 [Candidatus Falkowbacteria bacterium RBG_13_39_14]